MVTRGTFSLLLRQSTHVYQFVEDNRFAGFGVTEKKDFSQFMQDGAEWSLTWKSKKRMIKMRDWRIACVRQSQIKEW
jgi:hypothetical protein